MPTAEPNDKHAAGKGRFASTHWSVVLAAARTASPEADAALETLCIAYWYPLYAYLRRSGHTHDAAEDLTRNSSPAALSPNVSSEACSRVRAGFAPGS